MKNQIFKYISIVVSIVCIVLFFVLFPNLPRDVLYNSYTYQQLPGYNIFVRLFVYLSATIIIFALIMILDKKIFLGTFLGQKSMIIYLAHGPMVRGLSMIIPSSVPTPIFISVVLTITVIIISVLIGKFCQNIKDKIIRLKNK